MNAKKHVSGRYLKGTHGRYITIGVSEISWTLRYTGQSRRIDAGMGYQKVSGSSPMVFHLAAYP